jgi:hypothetical protein
MRVRRVGSSALTVFAGTAIMSSGLVSAFLAGTHVARPAYTTVAATNTCGQHPATAAINSVAVSDALIQLDSVSSVELAAAASPSASATASSPAASPSASTSAPASPTDPPSSSPPPSPSPTPSTPAPTTASPSPSPTPTVSSPPVRMCVSVQAVTTSVQPGGTASYAIWVWPSGGTAKGITVTASGKVTAAVTPRFSVCPSASGATCTVGTLAAAQADELLATLAVPKTAKSGQHATLTANAKATGATAASPASVSALISATAATKPSATSGGAAGSAGASSALGATLPGGILPLTPSGVASSSAALPFLPGPTTDAGGLFPTVAPAATPSAEAQPNAAGAPVTDTADSFPLSTRLLGGQVLSLAVLAAALVIAIARLSLREPHRPDGRDPAADPAAPDPAA